MKISLFQSFVRLKLLARKNLKNDICRIEKVISNITTGIEKNYKSNRLKCDTYVIYNTRLEEINTLLVKSVSSKNTIKGLREILDSIIIKLKILAESTGSFSFLDIIYLLTGSTETTDYLTMINSIFIPTNYNTYRSNIKYSFKNKKECIQLYDQRNIKKYKNHIFLNLYNESSIDEIIYGSRYYYFIDRLQLILVCDGYLVHDPFDNYRNKYFIDKYTNLGVLPANIDLKINEVFYKKYINQLSLKEFLVLDNEDIILKYTEVYNLFNKIKIETISSLVKMFLSCTPFKQRQILISLFLDGDNSHFNYLSFLLFDLINNDSFILKATPVSEEIYNSFHWSIKKNFRINFSKYKTKNDFTKNFNENTIPYDKRINLMKTDDQVKAKAFNKLKEIENNRSDSSKSTQYLDGLLKIPFGIFRKEYIFGCLEGLMNDFNNYIQKYKLNNNNQLKNRNDVIKFLKNYNELNNSLLENIFNDQIDLLNYNDYKVSDILEFVTQCNYLLETKFVLKKAKKEEMFISLVNKIKELPNIKDKINIGLLFGIDIVDDNEELSEFDVLNQKWDNYKTNILTYINKSTEILDKAVYKQHAAKNEIIRIIGQWINGTMSGYCLGFEGPPGVGKTSLVQRGISQCLKGNDNTTRPFSFIQMGGTSNGSILEGHGYTYQGSKWGKLVDILMDSQCMNPIIYIDELDKISNTETGRELIGILTHITDRSQNKEFEDKYFSGIKIDLSQILFIFSYNDPSLIDRVLMDRIHRIKFSALTTINKIHIINNFSMPDILEDIGISTGDIILPDEIIEYIVNTFTNESGLRKLKEKIYEIMREINIRNLRQEVDYPYTVDMELLDDIFKNNHKLIPKKIHNTPRIGLVNGLYATTTGVGGITIIEIFKTIGDSHMSMHLTGKQGDVMKESMNCSRTLAWNIIPDKVKEMISEEGKKNKWSFHIHCPDTSTPKDGPSAGAAITLALISLLTNTPILNTVALTGEIDLNGNVNQIGGLGSKIEGGKKAGVKLLLYPESNNQDIDIIKNNEPQILENIELRPVNNIWEVLELCLVENDIKFNKY